MTPNEKLTAVLESSLVRNSILAVILFNAVILGLETSEAIMAQAGGLILTLDRICLAIFVIELMAKLIAYRLQFFRKGWNIFDFVIVGISLAPVAEGFSALRALRILRVLRIISVAPNLRRVVEGFVTALPGMASVFLLMSLIFYIGAVMATKLFGTGCAACTPAQAADFDLWFGTLGRSAYSLFQIMTLESWSMGIVRPVMVVYPLAWMFFVPFIMMTTFAVVNLLVGLIVNSMQDAHQEESVASTDAYREDVKGKLELLEAKIDQLIATRRD
jgi:voltage-gated sodium channel